MDQVQKMMFVTTWPWLIYGFYMILYDFMVNQCQQSMVRVIPLVMVTMVKMTFGTSSGHQEIASSVRALVRPWPTRKGRIVADIGPKIGFYMLVFTSKIVNYPIVILPFSNGELISYPLIVISNNSLLLFIIELHVNFHWESLRLGGSRQWKAE